MADHPITFSAVYGWILEVRGGCARHAVLLGLRPEPLLTRKLYKLLFDERSYWMWPDGSRSLFSDNWDDTQVDTSIGYHLYIVNTDTGAETPYAYSGAETFFSESAHVSDLSRGTDQI